MAPDAHSVTRLIERMKNSDPDAAGALWERFMERMLAVARRRLGNAPRRVADEEDVVIVAFERFHHGIKRGRFPRLNDRDDLWSLLFTLITRHALRQLRDQQADKRGGGQVRGDSALGVEELVDDALTPAEAFLVQDNFAHLLAVLGDDSLRQIALARMEGYSNAEIAGQLGRSEVTVERRLNLIREIWQRHDAAEKSDSA